MLADRIRSFSGQASGPRAKDLEDEFAKVATDADFSGTTNGYNNSKITCLSRLSFI